MHVRLLENLASQAFLELLIYSVYPMALVKVFPVSINLR
jgi:hypothetical protein